MTNTPNAAALQQAVAAVENAVKDQKLSASSATNLKRWLTEPFFAAYQPAILATIQAGDFGKLDSVFWEVIPFGTGGRRGMMADYGSATINVRTIAESAQGLAAYLHKATGKGGGRAVIAHDTRNRSDEFAKLTATTLAANGLQVFFFESKRSTPELSFAVRHLKCDVGVVVSASHNPPSDNGFKAYWSNGAQVLPPHDKGIIDCVYEAREIPTLDFDQAVAEGKIEIIGEQVDRAYIDELLKLSLSKARGVSAVFTPLHGVGETSVYRLLREAGFDQVSIFEPQRAADGNFTNVPDQLPNPERTAVFKPAIEQAKKNGADLVLASDPDADRLGVCVRGADGEYVHLTGNRVGALLTDYILRQRAAAKSLSNQHYVVETLVTTPLISVIAKSHHVRAIDDLLVGFKYIGQTMDREGPDKFVFGAEESLGYLAGTYARDKDAGIAAMYVMELAAELKAAGKTLLDRLDELHVAHGFFLEDQRSEVREGPQGKQQIDRIMHRLRTSPPGELAGIRLARVLDYAQHEIRGVPGNKRLGGLPAPSGDLVIFETEPGRRQIRLAVRPSGTEPKIKFYYFAREDCDGPAQLAATRVSLQLALQGFMNALSDWTRQE